MELERCDVSLPGEHGGVLQFAPAVHLQGPQRTSDAAM
jgi:hypothetical protein